MAAPTSLVSAALALLSASGPIHAGAVSVVVDGPTGGLSDFEKALEAEGHGGLVSTAKHVHGHRLPEELAAENAEKTAAAESKQAEEAKHLHSLAEGLHQQRVKAKLGEPGRGPVMDMAEHGETTCTESLASKGCRCFTAKPRAMKEDPCYGIYPCVDCSGQSLASFPEDLPKSTSFLNLAGSTLDELPVDIFERAPKLTGLGLADSRLAELQPNILGETNGQKEIEEYIKDLQLSRAEEVSRKLAEEDQGSTLPLAETGVLLESEKLHKLPERPEKIRLEHQKQKEDKSGFAAAVAAPMSFIQTAAETVSSSRHATALQALSKVMASSDTCGQLFWFGFYSVDTCRDTWSPQYPSNCRCTRSGTAWPVKFCDATSGQLKTAKNSSEPFEKGKKSKMLEDEVFGVCDSCCQRDQIITVQLILGALSPFLISIGLAMKMCAPQDKHHLELVSEDQLKALAKEQAKAKSSAAAGSSSSRP